MTPLQNKIEEAKRRFYDKFSFIQAVKNEKSGNAYTRISDFLEQELTSIATLAQEEARKEIEETIGKHNARILNEFQNQGTADMPFIAYDERICLIPAMKKATEETLSTLSNNTQL